MKKNYISLIFTIFILCQASTSQAQVSGTSIFLPGHWLEVGIAANGSWNAGPAPSGYYPYTGWTNIGSVYNWQHNGWTGGGTPGPIFGDYMYPGTPFEGWAIQVNGARSDAFYTTGASVGTSFYNQTAAVSALTGANTTYTNTGAGGSLIGVWQGSTSGTSGGLSITQTTQLDTNASWVVITTVLKNTSATAIPGIYYWRTCDPDNDETYSGSYATNNTIVYQNDAVHRVMVSATGATYTSAYMALGAKDARAEALIYDDYAPYPAYGSGNSLDKIYAQTATGLGTTYYTLGTSTLNQDIAIGLIFNLGTISAGDSAVFSYAYIYDGNGGIDSAFPSIIGATTVCPGSTITLSDATTGGVWSSSNSTVATVSGTGVVSGVAAGTTNISYIAGTYAAGEVITVGPIPAITGNSVMCSGTTTTLNDAATGGIWSSSNSAVATISGTGVLSGVTSGTTNISYTTGACSVGLAVTVNVSAPITGPTSVCVGSTIALSDAVAGGTWSSSNIAKATVGASGIVTGVATTSLVPVIITYTLPGGCSATTTVTVNSGLTITSGANICSGGDTVTLNDGTSGGDWSSSSSAIATVGSSSGTVTGVSAGVATITCTTASGGCTAVTTLTVNPQPASIIAGMPVCVGGAISLSDATLGGVWTCSPSSIATIGPSTGIISGISNGSVDITYTLSGCTTTTTVEVNGPQVPQICEVNVDSASGKNLVEWEQFIPNRVAWFNIYRENSSSVFVKIDSQAANLFSTYLDTGSYPLIQSYSYQLTATDSCGNESPLGSSAINTTVHLSANLGVGGVINLSWNTYIGESVTTQNIMRSVGGAPFVNIAAVANTVTSYTDATPPSGSLVYEIYSVMASSCMPSARTSSEEYVSSNPVYINATGIQTLVADPEIQIYPNPTTAELTIETHAGDYNTYTITNTIGQLLVQQPLNNSITIVNVQMLPPGLYYVTAKGDNGSIVKKFVKM